MKFSVFITAIQGFFVGATMMVPGVSGGSMAMILGVYDKLIHALGSFHKHKAKSALFLLAFALPAIVGILLLAKPLLYVIEHYTMPAMYFFTGAVVGSVPMIIKKSQTKHISLKAVISFISGLLIVFLITLLPQGLFNGSQSNVPAGLLIQIVGGVIIAIALIFPGISVSHMLVLMGLYEPIMTALSQFDFIRLMPLAVGLLLGIVLTTRLIEACMARFPQVTYMVILGFIIGSARSVFPGVPSGITLLVSVFSMVIGFLLIYKLSFKEMAYEETQI